jgi:hypothetical protein
MYHYDPKGPVTNKLRLDRGAGQESETQKRGDKTTFICLGIGVACQIWAPRRVRYNGVTVAPRSVLAVFVRMIQWGREWSDEDRTRFWRVWWQPGGARPESGLASSLAGAVPGGVFTRWCGAGGEDVDCVWGRS